MYACSIYLIQRFNLIQSYITVIITLFKTQFIGASQLPRVPVFLPRLLPAAIESSS